MFKISRRLDYGIQLMIALAAEPEQKPVATAALAKRLDIPLPFMHQIGHTLMQAGLIKASPGPRGGLRLNLPSSEITLLRIAEVLEGPICVNVCLDCGETCPHEETCTAQPVWQDVQNTIKAKLGSTSLASLV